MGTREEINAYLKEKTEDKPFSWYFSRKFADFAGLYTEFFAVVMLAALFYRDTRKNTYELLHTKPVSPAAYVTGKVLGGFLVCGLVLGLLNLIFWLACLFRTRGSGFEVRLTDFLLSTVLYILPNMLMMVCVYALISVLFKNPLPAAPLLILYMLYSNMGSRNAEGLFGFYGRPLAIMVRFPGRFFETSLPPMVVPNQMFLLAASLVIILICVRIWKGGGYHENRKQDLPAILQDCLRSIFYRGFMPDPGCHLYPGDRSRIGKPYGPAGCSVLCRYLYPGDFKRQVSDPKTVSPEKRLASWQSGL